MRTSILNFRFSAVLNNYIENWVICSILILYFSENLNTKNNFFMGTGRVGVAVRNWILLISHIRFVPWLNKKRVRWARKRAEWEQGKEEKRRAPEGNSNWNISCWRTRRRVAYSKWRHRSEMTYCKWRGSSRHFLSWYESKRFMFLI